MKNTTSLAIVASTITATIALSSCGTSDPEYKEWKKQKDAQAGSADNPYGAPAAGTNPYGTPQSAGESGAYTRAAGAAPYQPLPGLPQSGANAPSIPGPPSGATPPAAGGISHTVVSGDSLWALARKYGTSIEAIQSANGISDTNIRTGQTLIIPGR